MLQPKDTDWLNEQKQYLYIGCLQETHLRPKDTYRVKIRGWKNIFHANRKQKKVGVAILISDKIYLKIKKIAKGKERHYIMIKESTQEKAIIVNIYLLNIGSQKKTRVPEKKKLLY